MAEEEEAKGGGKKKLLMIVLPAVLVLAGGGYFMMGGSGDAEAAEAEAAAAAAAEEVVEGEVIEVGKMTVNLADEDELRYARVGIAVVLSATADSAVVGTKIPLVQDSAITVIAGMTSGELRSPAGIETLRSMLTADAQEIFPDGDVVRVVLTEMIIQ
jgi:flagellar FliL protein